MRSYSTSRRSGGEGIGQRVLAVEFDVAVGAEDEHAVLRREAGDVAHHGDGAAVGPVQVVEHEHHGRALRRRDEELRYGIDQAKALFVGLERRGLLDLGQTLAECGHKARDGRRTVAEVRAQRIRLGVSLA